MTSPLTKVSPTLTPECSNSLQRQGAGAVYLSAHHPDIMRFLDTKRENADEKIRIKTLSLGVVIPDITFELAKKNEDMYLFSPYDVERVYGVPFADISVSEKYDEMVDDSRIRKSKIKARDFFQTLAEVQFESGYPYIVYEDTVNKDSQLKGRINMSNLCVAPETKILTSGGQEEISKLEGQTVNVWNGEQFSKTTIKKTGENQKLVTVTLDNGATIDATEYHKWYVQRGYPGGRGKNKDVVEELRTEELVPGDKLIKFDLPVLSSNGRQLPAEYTNGFFTADGTYGGVNKDQPKVYLYGEKKYLVPHLDIKSGSYQEDSSGRLCFLLHDDLLPKFTVPSSFSLESKLEWLAGLIDGDGSGDGRVGIQIGSNKPEFLEEIRLMLQTLGVNSRVNVSNKGGLKRFKEDQKEYMTKDMYRLLISGYETQKLLVLGLRTHRVILEREEHNRAAGHFVKVVSVEDHGRVDDTFCFTEELRGMGVFNGVLTGQCSEILQVNTASEYDESGDYVTVGRDISCNLGSLNIAKVMDSEELGDVVETAIRALTAVSDLSNIASVKSVAEGNDKSHAIGLGQMNLHGFLARESIHYGSEEGLDFTNQYFYTVTYHAIRASNLIAKEKGEVFAGFADSKYATGEYFDKYINGDWSIQTQKVRDMVKRFGFYPPTKQDWAELASKVKRDGMYNAYLQAVPPTGSISYINNSTSSIHPIASPIEIRKEGKLGRVYYPAPFLTNENKEYFQDAYEIGYEKIIDTYAVATQHVDQGLSLTLFFKDTATTRDINKAQIYAWKKGIKTLYYIRLRQLALSGTEVDGCVSCML